jgi:hypothetical protein
MSLLIPTELRNAITWVWTDYESEYTYVALNSENCIGTTNAQWLRSNTKIEKLGIGQDREVVAKLRSPKWMQDELRKYRATKGGSQHPVNKVTW